MIRGKQGAIGIIVFFVILFSILIIGFAGSILVGIIDFASDEITPVFKEIGGIGDLNVSETAGYALTPMNTFVQAMPWLVGFGYVVMLMVSVVFVLSYRINPNPFYIAFYISLIILLIFGSVIISNMYENIYTVDDEIGTRLQEQTILSYMILYSPVILTLIAFMTGILLFAGKQDEGGGGI